MSYQCPLCSLPLTARSGGFACDNNHQFDCAKEGYVNLMLVQHKRSKQPGDNVAMMQARRRFLATEHYHPLRKAVAKLCVAYAQNTTGQLLDIGCGEGYYTAYIAKQLLAQQPQAKCYGVDISKVAIRYGAKRYTSDAMQFCVASSQRLPFANASLNIALRIYAPCQASELARVLSEQGVVITVTPAGRHLYQLKELVYQTAHLHDETPEPLAGFTLVEESKLSYDMTLTGQQADDLLQMTPFAWRANAEVRNTLAMTAQCICSADFMIRVYQKQSHPAVTPNNTNS